MSEKFDGYISCLNLGGKRFGFKCAITEVFQFVCKNCGAPVELHFGGGKCEYCGTSYTTQFYVEEK